MKYYEVEFTIYPLSADACDLLAAMAGEAGFETFEETDTGVKGYVQQALFSEDSLKAVLEDFPFEATTINYTIREAEDRDWNEQWEQEGFEPIVITKKVENTPAIIIHDGRHLPEDVTSLHISPSTFHQIEIDAKLAFGTGTHETTRMVCSTLLDLELEGKRVLDCGTGTGILSICALKLGAREAVGYDIDEWSADNARHNAVINQVDDRFTALLGDASILNKVEGPFDLVMANINRNILLNDMPRFREKMATGGRLVLSGFYTEDIPQLTAKADTLDLQLESQKSDKNWACIVLR
jgi:ribosomal protein L11 methyltransferase